MKANFGEDTAELITTIQAELDVRIFVETGTNIGETAEWASERFDEVFTIELSEKLYAEAIEQRGHIENIQFLKGKSQDKLLEVLTSLNEQAIFYLDAHCGDKWLVTEDPEVIESTDLSECPVIDELEAIAESDGNHFIFIDDAAAFTSPRREPFEIDDWPNIQEVIDALEQINSSNDVMIYDGHIIATPPDAKNTVKKKLRELKTRELIEDRSPLQEFAYTVWISTLQPTGHRINDALGNSSTIKKILGKIWESGFKPVANKLYQKL